MSQPTLGPIEQQMFLDQIAAQLMRVLPPGRRKLVVLFDRLGRAGGYTARVTRSDGGYELCDLPAETLKSFDRLRAGMHVDGRGTWFSCRFSMIPDRWDVQYNRSERPDTTRPPTPEDFALEQQRFPRSEADMPERRHDLDGRRHEDPDAAGGEQRVRGAGASRFQRLT